MKKMNLFVIALISLVLTGCSSVDFTKTSTYTLTNLSYEVPDVFEMRAIDGTSEYGSEYNANAVSYSYSDKKHNCYLYLAQYNYEFPGLEEMVKLHFDTNDDSVYTQKNINNSYWEYGAKDNDYIYVINHNGKGYIITYKDLHKCSGVKDIIENSLKFN
jgi:hypothetical protein